MSGTPEVRQIQQQNIQVLMDRDQIDHLITNQGVRMLHFKAMRCPVGLVDLHDNRRPHEDHAGCSNGFLYQEAGLLYTSFTGNASDKQQMDPGLIDGSTVQVTASRYYEVSGKPVRVLPFDRFYLEQADIVVSMWETFQVNESGVDKLKFPVVEVDYLIDSTGKSWGPSDYTIRDGRLRWGPNRPVGDPASDIPAICSIRYTYRPYWYVAKMTHELRVVPRRDKGGPQTSAVMPQAFILQREYVFENAQNDDQSVLPNDPRQQRQPGDGGFGP